MVSKEFAVSIKLHNNLLRSRREELGLSTRELAEKVGVNYHSYLELENLRKKPYNTKDWSPAALKLADFYRVLPEDLFPPEICGVQKNRTMLEMSVDDMRALTDGHGLLSNYTQLSSESPEELLELRENLEQKLPFLFSHLSKKEAEAVTLRYGLSDGQEKELSEVASKMRIHRSRVQQLCADAERRLRGLLSLGDCERCYHPMVHASPVKNVCYPCFKESQGAGCGDAP